MKRTEYSEALVGAAKRLQEHSTHPKLPPFSRLVVDAVAASVSYHGAAEFVKRNLLTIPNPNDRLTDLKITPDLVRRCFRNIAKEHGIPVPKQPHTVKPKKLSFRDWLLGLFNTPITGTKKQKSKRQKKGGK